MYNIGLLFAKKNDFTKAIWKFNKSIEIRNDNPYAYIALADAYEKKGEIL